MKIIEGTTKFHIEEKTAISLGKFDGIHVGHQALLKEILAQKQRGYAAAVFTFDVSPGVLLGQREQKEITTREEKRDIFAKKGVDYLIEFPFNMHTAAMEPETFLREVLTEQMNGAYIAAGEDVSFGAKGGGNANLLRACAKRYGYQACIVDKLCYEGREISSTFVREELEQGNMETVSRLLGEAFRIQGQVVYGRRLGRELGMPTLNLLPPAAKLLPPNGVYYSSVGIGGQRYKGITNIGYKPTVTDEKVMGVETYVYDFDREIYGDIIEVYLHAFKRPEMKFGSVEELKAQMQKDVTEGKYF